MYKCPKCKTDEGSFEIHDVKEINIGSTFVDADGDSWDDKFTSSEQEYGNSNAMTCIDCDHKGTLLEFKVEE